jgi:hypothetical protein
MTVPTTEALTLTFPEPTTEGISKKLTGIAFDERTILSSTLSFA